MNEYPKSIAEVGEEGYAALLHIAPDERAYQRGWNDGYGKRYASSLDLLDDDYWDGYEVGLDERAEEGVNGQDAG